jgi:hypothetical protein
VEELLRTQAFALSVDEEASFVQGSFVDGSLLLVLQYLQQ